MFNIVCRLYALGNSSIFPGLDSSTLCDNVHHVRECSRLIVNEYSGTHHNEYPCITSFSQNVQILIHKCFS